MKLTVEQLNNGKQYNLLEFESMDDYVSSSLKSPTADQYKWADSDFRGASSINAAAERARNGCPEIGRDSQERAYSSVRELESDAIPTIQPTSYNDVAGAYCDVGLYLDGEPECMINYQPASVSSYGAIVDMVVNGSANRHIDSKALEKRGRECVRAIIALELAGYQVSVTWEKTSRGADGNVGRIVVPIKSAGGILDPGALAYAIADVSMLRLLGFANMGNYAKDAGKLRSPKTASSYDGIKFQKAHPYHDDRAVIIPGMNNNAAANIDLLNVVRKHIESYEL